MESIASTKIDSPHWESLIVPSRGTEHNKDVIIGSINNTHKENYDIENISGITAEIDNVITIHELRRHNSVILIDGEYNANSLDLDVRLAFSGFLTPC